MTKQWVQDIQGIDGIEIELDKDLRTFSTLQLAAVGDLIVVKKIESLKKLLTFFHMLNVDYEILGNGSNILLPEKGEKPFIKIELDYDASIFNEIKNFYEVPASVPLQKLTAKAIKFNLSGWEVFTGIPASLGGAIAMNAGTSLGEICEILEEVTIVTKHGKVVQRKLNKDDFSYRKNHFLNPGDIIVSAKLTHHGSIEGIGEKIKKYLHLRTETQPLWEKTCGCTFKNLQRMVQGESVTCRAGQFIDKIGLKGFQHKNLRVSPKHANFIENLGGATREEFLELVEIINSKVKEEDGFTFDTEVVHLH